MNLNEVFEINKSLWNKKTSFHKDSDFYNVEDFKHLEATSLTPIELEALGDLSGKKVLHLQCHFGLDTMSLARLGAEVTGVDFSEEAIELANQLAKELEIPAQFICANIYDLPEVLNQQFDLVFTSYGVVSWLPDLQEWGQLIKQYLKPTGTFYIAEFHPMMWMFDEAFSQIEYPYFNVGAIELFAEGSYADEQAEIQHREFNWHHSLSEIMMALIQNGLHIEDFQEYPYSPYNCFPNLIASEDGYFRMENRDEMIPMVFSIKASNSASKSS